MREGGLWFSDFPIESEPSAASKAAGIQTTGPWTSLVRHHHARHEDLLHFRLALRRSSSRRLLLGRYRSRAQHQRHQSTQRTQRVNFFFSHSYYVYNLVRIDFLKWFSKHFFFVADWACCGVTKARILKSSFRETWPCAISIGCPSGVSLSERISATSWSPKISTCHRPSVRTSSP